MKLLRVGILSSPFISDTVCRDGFVRLVDKTAKLLGFDLTVKPSDNHHIRFLADLPVGCDPEDGTDNVTNPFEPLSDDARSEMQEKVDTFYDRLVAMVAHGRRAAGQTVTDGMVRLRWGAKMFTAEEAVRLLMADRVGTLEQVVGQLAGRAYVPRSLRA